MGTNYYRKPLLTKERKERMKQYIDDGKIKHDWEEREDVINSLQDMIDEQEGVHICKMSCGWKTCFDHNWGKYYQPNKASIDKFIREEGYALFDEYGEQIDIDEFWDDVAKRDAKEGALCSKEYNEWERKKHPDWNFCHFTSDAERCRTEFGVEPEDNDFVSDGLRFAVFTDFCQL